MRSISFIMIGCCFASQMAVTCPLVVFTKILTKIFRSDFELGTECYDECVEEFSDCERNCRNNTECIFECHYVETDCQMSCPCFQKCQNGCTNCQSSYCNCREPETGFDYLKCKERVHCWLIKLDKTDWNLITGKFWWGIHFMPCKLLARGRWLSWWLCSWIPRKSGYMPLPIGLSQWLSVSQLSMRGCTTRT